MKITAKEFAYLIRNKDKLDAALQRMHAQKDPIQIVRDIGLFRDFARLLSDKDIQQKVDPDFLIKIKKCAAIVKELSDERTQSTVATRFFQISNAQTSSAVEYFSAMINRVVTTTPKKRS